ncbi:hypothetical protein LUZ61_019672 [Rhynchospora tenuis]|uniref:Uncharacterized protein n=1 Tax=Rhynchospora tenuis TaxID=198213 RepID=A0AAD5ZBL8_9POAL|nr:hypothetical protein LUZ61_019672 [Rhynchospora tenuis]
MVNLEINHNNLANLDDTLGYINQILFEENQNGNIDECFEAEVLQAIENSFYDVLEENHTTSQLELQQSYQFGAYPMGLNQVSGFIDDIRQVESTTALEYKKGMEEGMKFLPGINNNELEVDPKATTLSLPSQLTDEANLAERKLQEGKGKKKTNSVVLSLLEEQKHKIPMFYNRNFVRDEMFDKVLLWHGENYEVMCPRSKKNDKEINGESDHLRALLLQCSQAIAMNEYHRAKGLVKEIKKHCSPDGDGVQRLAHILVSGLDARLAGTGNELYNKLVPTCSPTRDILNAHCLLQSASPFIRASFYFANKTIIDAVQKTPKVHVIDFGIDRGFQWPSLMQGLSQMKGGPPKLRITGIDISRPGFSSINEETGWRLKDYARSFSISFEYNGILGDKWESICIEDLNIERDEMLVVNSLYRFENYRSETDGTECSRNEVLDIIRKIRPHIFVHGIINGSFDDAFFITRFRQVLLHYSAMFDFLNSIVPKENKQRQFIERVMWAHEAVNAIACEGSERIKRPEIYKKWHQRNLAAGFEQLPLNPAIIKRIKNRVSAVFNNSFYVEDDRQWLLFGWKGRIINAISTWRPKQI